MFGSSRYLARFSAGHAERIGLHLDLALAASEGVAHNGVNLADLRVGHREAAGRRADAMHHDGAALVSQCAVIGVGIADVECEVIGGVRLHLRGRDRIEALRHLTIALVRLGAELAGPAADRIGLQQRVAAIGLHLPDFELRLLFVGANEDGRALRRVHLLHQSDGLGGDRVIGVRADGAKAALFAAGQKGRSCGDQRKRSDAEKRIPGTHGYLARSTRFCVVTRVSIIYERYSYLQVAAPGDFLRSMVKETIRRTRKFETIGWP